MGKISVIAILVLSLAGCALQADVVDLENEVRRMKGILLETQRDVSIVQKSQQSIKTVRTAQPGSRQEDEIEGLQRNQADIEIRFNQLATDVQVIQGRLEENNHMLAELSESVDDQGMAMQELSRKMDIIEAGITVPQRKSDKILLPGKEIDSDNIVKPVQPGMPDMSPVPPPQPLQSPPVPPAEGTRAIAPPSDLYNQAYKDYILGNYDLAIAGFSNYLRRMPDGNLAPNALYWIGECYYSKGDYSKAVTAFESVTIDYPKSEKVVSGMLKMGYGYENMGNKALAKVYLKKVVEQFPYSQEASFAKVKLTELQ